VPTEIVLVVWADEKVNLSRSSWTDDSHPSAKERNAKALAMFKVTTKPVSATGNSASLENTEPVYIYA
jgi:hypothetical protein